MTLSSHNPLPKSASNKPAAEPLHIIGGTTPEQHARLLRFLQEASKDASVRALQNLDHQTAQLVLESGDKLKSAFIEAVVNLVQQCTVSDRFADEESPSQRQYPPTYQIRPVEAQVTALRKYFPQLGACMERLSRRPLPQDAEGWFAIPRWKALAPTYNEALQMVVNALAEQRRFSNRLVDKLGSNYLRQNPRIIRAEAVLAEQQPATDIFVVAAQLGMLHRGRSARRARVVMHGNEFGLGAFAMGCILLTHPERISTVDTLMIDCAGDEYSLTADGHFDRVPLYDYDLGGIQFSVFYEDRARHLWGSPSGFLFLM